MKTLSTLVLGALGAVSFAQTTYSVHQVGLPAGGYNTRLTSLNDAGQIVGYDGFDDGGLMHYQGFVYTVGGGRQYLTPHYGHPSNFAYGINESGTVVGDSQDAGRTDHAVRWTAGGLEELNGAPAGNLSIGSDINESGTVVGTYGTDTTRTACIWRPDGAIQSLGYLQGGTYSFSAAINDAGAVVGLSDSGPGDRAYVWTLAGGMQSLGILKTSPTFQSFSDALDINNQGQIVGISDSDDGSRAFIYSEGLGMRSMGVFAGGSYSKANSINDLGQAVGYSYADGYATVGAFLWTEAGGMVDLNSMLDASGAGWHLNNALQINGKGQIIGSGYLNGEYGWYLLTPNAVPEPASFVALGLGALVLAKRRKK